MEGNEVNPVDTLTEGQRERIERNKEKARTLREARIASHPYERASFIPSLHPAVKPKTVEDTHGGFLLEEEEETTRVPTYKLAEDNSEFLCAISIDNAWCH